MGTSKGLSKTTLCRVLKEVKECALQTLRETASQAQGKAGANVLREECAWVSEEHATGTESEEVGYPMAIVETQQTWPSHRGLGAAGGESLWATPLHLTPARKWNSTCVRFSVCICQASAAGVT